MSFTPFQRLIAQLTLEAIADLGFALGGGQALHAHGYGDRLSLDLDFYVTTSPASPPTSPDGQPNCEPKTSTTLTGNSKIVADVTRSPAVCAEVDVGVDVSRHYKRPHGRGLREPYEAEVHQSSWLVTRTRLPKISSSRLSRASWQLLLAAGGSAVGRFLAGPRGRLGTALASSVLIAVLAVPLLF